MLAIPINQEGWEIFSWVSFKNSFIVLSPAKMKTLADPWLTLLKIAVFPPVMTVSGLPLTSWGILREKVDPIL